MCARVFVCACVCMHTSTHSLALTRQRTQPRAHTEHTHIIHAIERRQDEITLEHTHTINTQTCKRTPTTCTQRTHDTAHTRAHAISHLMRVVKLPVQAPDTRSKIQFARDFGVQLFQPGLLRRQESANHQKSARMCAQLCGQRTRAMVRVYAFPCARACVLAHA